MTEDIYKLKDNDELIVTGKQLRKLRRFILKDIFLVLRKNILVKKDYMNQREMKQDFQLKKEIGFVSVETQEGNF